jgi:hypothetical protein
LFLRDNRPARTRIAPLPRITRRGRTTLLTIGTLLAVTACSSAPAAESADESAAKSSATPHGYVAGATEESEPQLHLATITETGQVDLLDLLTSETTTISAAEATSALTTDGRFLFGTTPKGLSIVDTGVWTVDHEDHSHYYRAEPTAVGILDGTGPVQVASGTSLTTVYFSGTGERIVLDRDALGTGEIEEVARTTTEPHTGMMVPFGSGLLATVASAEGPASAGAASGDSAAGASAIEVLDASGEATGQAAECVNASGTIGTPVGQVFGCASGALLVTEGADGSASFEQIPYPDGVGVEERAGEFRGRPGRPTVAAVAGTTGAWLLDTRERTWTLLPTETPLLQVSAVDDSDEHVVALDATGRILALDATTGAITAATEPLLAASIANPALLAGVELTVDTTRAYINSPSDNRVYEIDFADSARVARTFDTAGAPLFLAQTGR